MTYATKVDDHTWLAVVSPDANNPEGGMFCVTVYPCMDDHPYQLMVFDLHPKPLLNEDEPRQHLHLHELEIRTEVINTTVWAVDVPGLVKKVVEDLIEAANPWYPIELTYEYGGLLRGAQPPFYLNPTSVH